MRVLETFSEGKQRGSTYCEDRLIQSSSAVGVIDGSRGPYPGDVDVVAAFLDDAVRLAEEIDESTELEGFVSALSEMVRRRKEASGLMDFKATGAFVFCLYAVDRREVWRVGDCMFSVNGAVSENPCKPEVICSKARASVIHAWIELGSSHDDIMSDAAYDSIIDPLLWPECGYMNAADRNLGFGAINGEPVPDRFLERVSVDGSAVIEVCSDGYPALMGSLRASEENLKHLLEIDPMCAFDNIGSKGLGPARVSFDDRTYVRFMVD